MNKEKHLEDLFQAARSQAPVQSFDETKSRFLNELKHASSSSDMQVKSIHSFKNIIIMITTIGTVIIAALIWKANGETQIDSKTPTIRLVNSKTNPHNPHLQKVDRNGIPEIIALPVYKKHVSPETHQVYYIPILGDDSIVQKINNFPIVGPMVQDEEYKFPKLTEKEIDANHKKKKQMLKALEKFDKKEYIRLPSGTFQYEGKMTSLQSFIIQKTEVTNLEYRTFLFDLLIQGRKDEFLKAKPDQSQWTKSKELIGADLGPMEETYFSHTAYNEYPVVNISLEGANMYCKWLSQELMKFVDKNKQKQFNDVRLPARVEWIYAASAGGSDYPYPWKGQFLRNSDGCFLANYKPFENSYQDDGGFLTVKTETYNPNSVGIYNMSGNVAEMVYNDPNSRDDPGTAGGGWMNNAEEIKILGPDPYSGNKEAHPNIGFRVVMTFTNY